jgi:hypothetical protein
VSEPLCRAPRCFFATVLPVDGHRHFLRPDQYRRVHLETTGVPGRPNVLLTRRGTVMLWALHPRA